MSMSDKTAISSHPVAGPRFVPGRDAARIYGVSLATLRRWSEGGIVPPGIRIGGRRLWLLSDLEAHIKSLEGGKDQSAAACQGGAR
jgi:hypothetical protein